MLIDLEYGRVGEVVLRAVEKGVTVLVIAALIVELEGEGSKWATGGKDK